MKLLLMRMFLSASFILASIASAQAKSEIHEGFEYLKVVPAQQTRVKEGQIEVIEVFWYGCPHCFRFEPYVKKWLKTKPKNVVFFRIPATFNPGWDIHAKAFYTAELLKVGDKIHAPLFDAMHKTKDKKKLKAMYTEDGLAAFFKKHGVDEKKFREVYNSFQVEMRVKQATRLGNAYGVEGVPSMIINGKYRVSASSANQSFDQLLKVVNYLIKKESVTK